MPELPEVETVRRGLSPTLVGAQLRQVDLNRRDLRFPFPRRMKERLEGATIRQLHRRAKYLLADLSTGETLIMHLGMSGSFRAEDSTVANRKAAIGAPDHLPTAAAIFTHERGKLPQHDHVIFHLQSRRVIYNDPRRFGFMLLSATETLDQHPLLAKLGVEPTSNGLNSVYLARRFLHKQSPLKAALLDQHIIAGLGNIYVCEALWRAKISPKRRAATVVLKTGAPTRRLEALTSAIKAVIGEAIEAGGSSLRDHIQADGSLGYFQKAHAVYDREGAPCPRSGCGGIIKRCVQSNRSSFYCPKCQR